jgi:hypothetical protein
MRIHEGKSPLTNGVETAEDLDTYMHWRLEIAAQRLAEVLRCLPKEYITADEDGISSNLHNLIGDMSTLASCVRLGPSMRNPPRSNADVAE